MNEELIAENMSLETAMILVKGIYEKYYLEPNLKVTIEKIEES